MFPEFSGNSILLLPNSYLCNVCLVYLVHVEHILRIVDHLEKVNDLFYLLKIIDHKRERPSVNTLLLKDNLFHTSNIYVILYKYSRGTCHEYTNSGNETVLH